MVKTKKKAKKEVLPVLAWKKTKTGGAVTTYKGVEFKLVPKPECQGWYWLLAAKEKRAEGTKAFCKEAAARMAARVGKGNPLGSTVGVTRKKIEDPEDFLVRMAVEFGYRPYFLAGADYVLKDAGIDPDELTPEVLKAATEKSWPLYRDKLEQQAERLHLTGQLRDVLGLPKTAPLAARDRAFQADVERERQAWFRKPGADKDDLEALARMRGDGGRHEPAAEEPGKPKVRGKGVERDPWGYPVHSKAGRINAAVTDEPKSAKRIAKEAGVNNAGSHLTTLVKKKLVKRLPDGTYRRRRQK